jgi:hypothetical protein
VPSNTDSKHKNSKELFKGNPEYWNLNGQAFYSTNMTWKQRSTIVNFYHKYFATCQQAAKEPFHIHGYTLNMDVIIYDTQRLRPILPTCGFSQK